jgi:HipA-like protein
MSELPVVVATRYATPLREGGSLPAIVEGDDGALWVAKFRGAGQGSLALVAEVIAGELGRAAGLNVPALARLELDERLARGEPDPEIADLLRASVGTNLAMSYLGAALPFDPAARPDVPAALASLIVAFDAFVMNVDRTARNPNLLWWRGGLWLIDHGAAFYWHHDWDGRVDARPRPFPRVADHVLLPWAAELPEAGRRLQLALDDQAIAGAVERVPESWLQTPDAGAARARRDAYAAALRARRDAAQSFIEEAAHARARSV